MLHIRAGELKFDINYGLDYNVIYGTHGEEEEVCFRTVSFQKVVKPIIVIAILKTGFRTVSFQKVVKLYISYRPLDKVVSVKINGVEQDVFKSDSRGIELVKTKRYDSCYCKIKKEDPLE